MILRYDRDYYELRFTAGAGAVTGGDCVRAGQRTAGLQIAAAGTVIFGAAGCDIDNIRCARQVGRWLRTRHGSTAGRIAGGVANVFAAGVPIACTCVVPGGITGILAVIIAGVIARIVSGAVSRIIAIIGARLISRRAL